MKEIYFAGGCFWGVEKYFRLVPKGIASVTVGYANGDNNGKTPSYEEVCSQQRGFVEAIKIIYDETITPLPFLLQLFYNIVDPFAINKQGNDVGVQYRSGIYYTDEGDKETIALSLKNLSEKLGKKVAIEALPLENFYIAEEYHQNYLTKNPTGYCHIGSDKYDKVKNALVDPTLFQKPDEPTLREALSKEAYHITQQGATEPPFQNEFWNHQAKGIYVDITTGEPLFLSADKYDAGCGWPSFTKPLDPDVVNEFDDQSLSRVRTEVKSRVGEAHLGHVFEDGPKEKGGLRYCINSGALRFVPIEQMDEEGYGQYISLLL